MHRTVLRFLKKQCGNSICSVRKGLEFDVPGVSVTGKIRKQTAHLRQTACNLLPHRSRKAARMQKQDRIALLRTHFCAIEHFRDNLSGFDVIGFAGAAPADLRCASF